MAKVAEKTGGHEKSEKLVAIFESARLAESFGDSLQGLTLEELIELKKIMDAIRTQEEASMTWGKFRISVNRALGKKLFPLNDIEKKQKIYRKLYEELSMVGSKIESARKQRVREYAKSFLEYMRTASPRELNVNLTEYNLNKYLDIGEEQRAPDADIDGKVVISCNETFDNNLQFLNTHIIEAIHRGNVQ